MYMCPVCGYDGLTEPPLNFTICPSCGTEFEYDDAFASHERLRGEWLRSGAQWWSPVDAAPDNWDPHFQVLAVGSSSLLEALHSTTQNSDAYSRVLAASFPLLDALRSTKSNQQEAKAFGDLMRALRIQAKQAAA